MVLTRGRGAVRRNGRAEEAASDIDVTLMNFLPLPLHRNNLFLPYTACLELLKSLLLLVILLLLQKSLHTGKIF